MNLGQTIHKQLKRLERAGNDDFQLILLVGAAAYETYELHQLLRRLRMDNLRCQKYRKQLFALGATIPFLLALATLFVALAQIPLTYFALGMMVVTIVSFGLGSMQLQQHYHHLAHTDELHYLIQLELEIRRSDAEIY